MAGILWRLSRLMGARRALLQGSPERALRVLRDPSLNLSSAARRLRAEALDALGRQAVQRRAQGRDRSAARMLGTIAAEDLGRAEECRARMRWVRPSESGLLAAILGAARTAGAAGPAGAANGNEERSAAPEDAHASPPGGSGANGAEPQAVRAAPSDGATGDDGPCLFQLSVDEGGQYLVAAGESFVVGHLRAGRADLPFLADVGAEHARLEGFESFRDGPGWRVVPLSGESVRVNGTPVPDEGRRLADGDEVELAVNLAFHVSAPDPASRTVRLDLMRGAECGACSAIILMGAGEGGRLRIGAGGSRHVRVLQMDEEVALKLVEHELVLTCRRGLHAGGPSEARRAGERSSDAPVQRELALPCPPPRRFEVSAARADGEGPPLCIAISPAEGLE